MIFNMRGFQFNHFRTSDMIRAMNYVFDALLDCDKETIPVMNAAVSDCDCALIFWNGKQEGADWEYLQEMVKNGKPVFFFPADAMNVEGEIDQTKLRNIMERQVRKVYGN